MIKISPTLNSNILDLYGYAGEVWLKNLAEHVHHLSSLWNFQFLRPMEALSYNFVALVKQNSNGQPAVLKMAPSGSNLATEARWLNCIQQGAPKLYEFDETLNAFLMEHLDPGFSLKKLVQEDQDDKATHIISQTILNFQFQDCPKANFRHLSQLSKAFFHLEGKIEGRLLSKAIDLYHDLTADTSLDIVLHGDLHHDNILASGSHWKAIDPHGYVGDPTSEVGVMIYNAFDVLPKHDSIPTIVERRLRILVEELPFDPQKIKDWAYCRAVLSLAWSAEDHGRVPKDVLDVVRVIDQIKL